ncbi:diguanylate cyclase [Actinoplanes subtropicus]|uniref:diguanylate cyclase n=1 Tax=Actinoplanes subtropicus TaxID=543632 RepID=UPI0007C4B8C8|nr:diguanylate cyclase [Actinoplanes subtropicus]
MRSRDEVLHDSDRTRVVRVYPADGSPPLIRKQPLGPTAADRLRNERDVLRRLDGVEGIPRSVGEGDGDALLLVDTPSRPLAALPAPWAAEPLIALARGLAGVLAAIHRHGVVHRDISPGNILVPLVDGEPAPDRPPTLIDFELATSMAEDRFAPVRQDGLAGTLPYLAPEQTGRTGRPVDHRADLYALGATLYELATGTPPFGRDADPLTLVHDHLARIPVPPTQLNPDLPDILSDIVMRLLAKEPEQRYQSGEGLAYDLDRLRAGDAAFPLAERDFPLRLAPPARLVGREAPLATLRGLFAEAVTGNRGIALVTGPPGVGKTALIDRLRPAVATAGGRFVTGKFDQYRRDLGADAVGQAFTALGAQLLAEPDEEVAALRVRLLDALGGNAGLAAAVLPSFAALLGVAPEETVDDPRTALARIRQVGIALLRCIASSAHPVVFFIDDLQWAGPAAFGFLDSVLDESDLPGVLVLGAFREAEVDEAHPLTAILARLRRTGGEMRLDNLPPGDLGTLLAEMLRLPVPEAAPLAEALAGRTGGNPFDTVELVNALRREGALVPEGTGWRWDAATLRRFVGRGDVVDLLGARIEALPASTRELLEVMACLGGEVDLTLLRVASGQPADQIGLALLPAAEDGLIVVSREGTPVASFRHDRVQQAAYGKMEVNFRTRLGLAIARRLADDPAYALAAAQQYLPALDEVTEPAERQSAAALLRHAATAARMVTNHGAAESFLSAALTLLDPADDSYRAVQGEWHASLCSLGKFAEADAVFEALEAAGPEPVPHTGPVSEQIVGWTNRGMFGEALGLGLAQLRRLGVAVPATDEMGPAIGAGLETVYGWLARDPDDDLHRPELADPRLVAIARVINRMIPPAFFSDHVTFAWLVMEAGEVWTRHGPAAALIGPFSHAGFVTIPVRGDYRAGYQAVRRVIAVGEARGYEPDTSQAKFLHGLGTIAWFEPVENGVRLCREARDGLLRGGDLQNAANTYYGSITQSLDCADLDGFGAEVESALSLFERIGYDHTAKVMVSYRQLRRALRGETAAPGMFTDDSFDEDAHLAAVADNPTAVVNFHLCRGMVAAAFGDEPAVARHSTAAMALLPFITATYGTLFGHLLNVLGAAARAGTATGADREAALADLRTSRDFLAARAADQPGNFRHLQWLADAETAVLAGDLAAAAKAYDAACGDATGSGRLWHTALIHERAGNFFLRYGMEHAGQHLLTEAFHAYAAWGAHAKARQLEHDHPFVAAAPSRNGARGSALGTTSSVNVSTEVIDLLAVLEAARALSSETDLERLRLRVEQVLSAMTGATQVRVVLWDDATGGWLLPADLVAGRPALSLAEAAEQRLLPLTALRYAERTREPMLVDDTSRDDRVARDPYLSGLEHCSLLVVPVLSQGAPKAMLVLENRLTRRAFTMKRLDAVQMIAGQLTVSLENALVYASLERKVAERTEALAEANRQLELLTITDPLTGLANRRRLTDVLEHEWLRALRSGESIGLAMIDIDNFKKYNDHYGHQGGDECLRLVARAAAASVRTTDLVARYGGEEFSIIMPGADAASAAQVAERARRAVADLRAPHALVDGGIVTISVGVTAGAPVAGVQPDSLIKIADEALYEAKRGGRNRVAVG